MKHVARIFSLLVLISAGLFNSGCDGGDDNKKSEEETQLEKLKSTWTIASASLDGQDRTADFSNLKLTISGDFAQNGTYNYSFTGTRPNPSPWPADGSWKFGTPVTSQIIRLNDNLPITYTVSATNLQLNFSCASCDYPGGRVSKVNGEWVFTFSK